MLKNFEANVVSIAVPIGVSSLDKPPSVQGVEIGALLICHTNLTSLVSDYMIWLDGLTHILTVFWDNGASNKLLIGS